MTLYDENERISWKKLFERFPKPLELQKSEI